MRRIRTKFQVIKAKDTFTKKQIRMPYSIFENGAEYVLRISARVDGIEYNNERNIDEAGYDYETGQRSPVIVKIRRPEGWVFYYRKVQK